MPISLSTNMKARKILKRLKPLLDAGSMQLWKPGNGTIPAFDFAEMQTLFQEIKRVDPNILNLPFTVPVGDYAIIWGIASGTNPASTWILYQNFLMMTRKLASEYQGSLPGSDMDVVTNYTNNNWDMVKEQAR